MSIKLIQDRLSSYDCKSELEEEHAIREITQEVALAALGRTDFFKHGVFQGGTCLRIFYGLNRFSEDLDFVLKEPNCNFKLQPHLQSLSEELQAYGYNVEIADRSKAGVAVKKAIKAIDWKATAEDVRRFVRVAEQPSLNLWSSELFLAQLGKLYTSTIIKYNFQSPQGGGTISNLDLLTDKTA